MPVSNDQLGNAVAAYMEQTYGKDQLGEGYNVVGLNIEGVPTLQLDWHREEVKPTDDQLNVAWLTWLWSEIRLERNELLDATDWCAHVDSPSMPDAMITYRQALRDLPTSTESAIDVVWPEKPS
jgi:hypothetical protein|tara:strand:- start:20 stop:391 length:372 start_codon:yes stop_codon:yes gene_type:complete